MVGAESVPAPSRHTLRVRRVTPQAVAYLSQAGGLKGVIRNMLIVAPASLSPDSLGSAQFEPLLGGLYGRDGDSVRWSVGIVWNRVPWTMGCCGP